jgi:hypothetical protein
MMKFEPLVTQLEDRVTPVTRLFATGAGQGGGPHVNVYNADGSNRFAFFAYASNFTGGVRVATGDVNGDGVDDIITAPLSGGGPQINVYNGVNGSVITAFFAYDPNLRDTYMISAGDVNGDGKSEIVTSHTRYEYVGGANYTKSVANVKVFNGTNGSAPQGAINSFNVESKSVTLATVAVGNVQGDGKHEIIVNMPNGGYETVPAGQAAPQYNYDTLIYDNNGILLKIFAAYQVFSYTYSGNGAGTLFQDFSTRGISAADVNGDGWADLAVTKGNSVTIVNVNATQSSNSTTQLPVRIGTPFRQPYGQSWGSYMTVSLKDLNNDGRADLITGAGPGGGPHLQVFSGLNESLKMSFFPYATNFTGGVFVG